MRDEHEIAQRLCIWRLEKIILFGLTQAPNLRALTARAAHPFNHAVGGVGVCDLKDHGR